VVQERGAHAGQTRGDVRQGLSLWLVRKDQQPGFRVAPLLAAAERGALRVSSGGMVEPGPEGAGDRLGLSIYGSARALAGGCGIHRHRCPRPACPGDGRAGVRSLGDRFGSVLHAGWAGCRFCLAGAGRGVPVDQRGHRPARAAPGADPAVPGAHRGSGTSGHRWALDAPAWALRVLAAVAGMSLPQIATCSRSQTTVLLDRGARSPVPERRHRRG